MNLTQLDNLVIKDKSIKIGFGKPQELDAHVESWHSYYWTELKDKK